MTRNGLTNLYGSKKITYFLYTGLILSIIGAVIIYTPVLSEQQHYLSLDSDQRMDYVLDEMSCNTILSSTELHKQPEIIPLKPLELSADGNTALTPRDEWVRAETIEECWDGCNVLFEGYTPEPDHYFFHVPFTDSSYMSFIGLDEKVEECNNE